MAQKKRKKCRGKQENGLGCRNNGRSGELMCGPHTPGYIQKTKLVAGKSDPKIWQGVLMQSIKWMSSNTAMKL